ncbi:MAG: fumarylacetoacetate hydrolase family protein [Myxococcota bacterium]
MKLCTIDDGSRDGLLCVATRDGTRACPATGIARTLQDALDQWSALESPLRGLAARLEASDVPQSFRLDDAARILRAPLPRAHQWIDGSAFLHHVRLVRKARGAEMPPSFLTDPLVYQGGSDIMLGPRDPIAHASEEWGIDFEAEIAVITDDVPYRTPADRALQHVKLVVLLNDVSLRNLIPAELAKGFGFFVSKPPTAFAPLAVTPDELGPAWHDGRLHLDVRVSWNGKPFGHPNAGVGMQFGFHDLIAHVSQTRPLGAGTIIGSGTVSNDVPGVGSCCIAEQRTIETLAQGAPVTPFMSFGDDVHIEVLDGAGHSVFGAITQKVVKA